MYEVTRIGLPNLLSQGEQIARSRGTMSGGELVVQELGAQALQREAVARAERLAPAHRVEAAKERERERRRGGGDGHGRHAEDGEDGDDGETHLVDVTA